MVDGEIRRAVIRALRNSHGIPLHLAVLRYLLLGYLGHGISNRMARRAISDAIVYDNAPIGSSQRGYFWVTSQETLNEERYDLYSRARELKGRAEQLTENYYAMEDGKVQSQLFAKGGAK